MPYPPKDGGSIATFSLAGSFSRLGHDVTVLAMNTSKHYFPVKDIPQEIAGKIRFIAVNVDTRIRPADLFINFLFSPMPYNAQRFVTREFENTLADLLKRENFDVIQLEGLYLAPYIPAIRKHSGALLSMRSHNVEHEIWERAVKQQSGLKNLYVRDLSGRIRKMEQKSLNMTDVLVPITQRDGERFRSMGCTLPIKVVPAGIDSSKLEPGNSKIEFPSLFHIGALDWIPNQEGLMWFLRDVWPAVHKDHPGVKFYIAGRNAPSFISQIKQPGVVFMGEVEDAYEFMGRKAVMVVPLLSGSGMRIKIIEGMALGKAIVSTPIGTEGIATTHGGNILVAGNAREFIDSVKRLVSDEALCRSMGENAVSFIKKNFDNLAIASSLISFYEEQLGW